MYIQRRFLSNADRRSALLCLRLSYTSHRRSLGDLPRYGDLSKARKAPPRQTARHRVTGRDSATCFVIAQRPGRTKSVRHKLASDLIEANVKRISFQQCCCAIAAADVANPDAPKRCSLEHSAGTAGTTWKPTIRR